MPESGWISNLNELFARHFLAIQQPGIENGAPHVHLGGFYFYQLQIFLGCTPMN